MCSVEPLSSGAATWQVVAAIVIFLVTYAFIITEKVNRAVVALAGSLLMVLLGIVETHKAYQHYIEWQTIFLLVGMMILVGITNRTGVFQYVAIWSAKKMKGDPVKILLMLCLLTAGGSAFLDNVTTVMLMVPVTLSITRILRVNPMPYLISEVIACNIGGTATLIGDPPNIMIGTATDLTFNDFLLNLAPITIVILAVTLLILRQLYAKQLTVTEEHKAELMNLTPADFIKNRALMTKSLVVLGLTLAGFLLHSVIHVQAAVIAFAGATLLILIGVKGHDAEEEVFDSVEWVTIFFFAGLFVLVGGLIEVGAISYLASKLLEITQGNMLMTSMLILWVSGIASATIDNIPFVATMIPMIHDLGAQMQLSNPAELNPVWWSLALGACLGGNGTLIGASANVIVAGMSAKEGHAIKYIDFLKIGAPLTLIALALSSLYVRFVYF